MPDEADSLRTKRGLDMVDQVYGKGSAAVFLAGPKDPYLVETIDHLFADIWSRPNLSVRDRRLLVIGATAALGRKDLIQIQIHGALANGELSREELDEIPLQLSFYVGWGNGATVMQGINAALQAHEAGSAQSLGQPK